MLNAVAQRGCMGVWMCNGLKRFNVAAGCTKSSKCAFECLPSIDTSLVPISVTTPRLPFIRAHCRPTEVYGSANHSSPQKV